MTSSNARQNSGKPWTRRTVRSRGAFLVFKQATFSWMLPTGTCVSLISSAPQSKCGVAMMALPSESDSGWASFAQPMPTTRDAAVVETRATNLDVGRAINVRTGTSKVSFESASL